MFNREKLENLELRIVALETEMRIIRKRTYYLLEKVNSKEVEK